MSEIEYQELSLKIARGLEIAEREMLEEKARRGEDVIISDRDGNIRSVPASQYL